MSHAVILPLTNDTELVITSDNSGAIGEKQKDIIHTSNIHVAYYAARVAMMELLSVDGNPQTIIIQNFTNDKAWKAYKDGVIQVLSELGLTDVKITGSSETNFDTLQSGLGLTAIGIRKVSAHNHIELTNMSFAVIGSPLVGMDVVKLPTKIAPLSLFNKLCERSDIFATHPIGSKGILIEWQTWTKRMNTKISCTLDIHKSGGPATCFIIAFSENNRRYLKEISGEYFHNISIKKD